MAEVRSASDPAADAGALLRRLGVAVLAVGLPLAALFSRRGVVVAVPIGVALLVIASVLDGCARPFRTSLDRLAGSTALVATGLLLGWAALSLLWTPAHGGGAERYLGLLATLALALAAYLALPERMRAANLYLIPVGTALAAAVAIAGGLAGMGSFSDGAEDGRNVERGLSVIALFAWPSIAWLRSRERSMEAVCLAVLVGVAALVGPQPSIPVGLAAGGCVFAAATLAGRPTAVALGTGGAAVLLLAPILPFLLGPVAAALLRAGSSWPAALEAWKVAVAADPARLITGQGFGAGRVSGILPGDTPDTPLVHLWFELGVLGAVAAAGALWAAGRALPRHTGYAPILPGVLGAVATAFMLGCIGIGSGQAWWPGALTMLALLFVCIERGQFRTRRPQAAQPEPEPLARAGRPRARTSARAA